MGTLTAAGSAQNYVSANIEAYKKGYWPCIAGKMFGLRGIAVIHASMEAGAQAVESNGSTLVGAYYHFTDGRFTAWGRSSKVLVPNGVAKVARFAKGLSAVSWAVTDVELFSAVSECSAQLR